jgi:hypothetical protein
MAVGLVVCLGALTLGPDIDRDRPLGGRCDGAMFAEGACGTGCLVGSASNSVDRLFDNIGSMGSTLAISTVDPESI